MLSINQNRDYSDMSFLDLCDLIDELKKEIDDLNDVISGLRDDILFLESLKDN